MKTFYYTVANSDTGKSVQVYSIVNNVPELEMNIHRIDLFSNTENIVRERISSKKGLDVNDIQLHIL